MHSFASLPHGFCAFDNCCVHAAQMLQLHLKKLCIKTNVVYASLKKQTVEQKRLSLFRKLFFRFFELTMHPSAHRKKLSMVGDRGADPLAISFTFPPNLERRWRNTSRSQILFRLYTKLRACVCCVHVLSFMTPRDEQWNTNKKVLFPGLGKLNCVRGQSEQGRIKLCSKNGF